MLSRRGTAQGQDKGVHVFESGGSRTLTLTQGVREDLEWWGGRYAQPGIVLRGPSWAEVISYAKALSPAKSCAQGIFALKCPQVQAVLQTKKSKLLTISASEDGLNRTQTHGAPQGGRMCVSGGGGGVQEM